MEKAEPQLEVTNTFFSKWQVLISDWKYHGSFDQNFLVINYDEPHAMGRIKTVLTQTQRCYEWAHKHQDKKRQNLRQVTHMTWWRRRRKRRVSQALTSSLGFQRVRENNGRAEGEKKKNRGERERETTQINVVITCHAHNRNSWPRSGKDKKESSVLRVAAKHPGDTLLRQFMMVSEFFPSFPIHRDNVVL